MTSLLEIRDLRASYGRGEVLHGVSLDVAQGAIITVIGANGAGKSTLVNAIMGVLKAEGQIRLEGDEIAHLNLERRVTRGLCLIPERRELFASLTVEDNLRLGGIRRPAGERAASLEKIFTQFPRLQERRRQLAGTLSGGERQMLAMGRALMARPRLLMLDEPSLGLAPKIVAEVFQILQRLKADGVSILLIEQNARAALRIADRAYVLELGTVSREGTASEISADPRLVESYLGLGGQKY